MRYDSFFPAFTLPFMPTYAIGDLQGCCEEFESLLKTISFDRANDTLWLVGDLVNRGPASLKTLRAVKALGNAAVTVLGNHDFHLLAAYCGIRKPGRNDTLDEVLAAPDATELIDWLRTRPLAHVDTIAGTRHLLVHAGIVPNWTVEEALQLAAELQQAMSGEHWRAVLRTLFGNSPSHWSDDLASDARLRCIVNILTRLRFCSAEGEIDFTTNQGADSAPDGFQPWFELRDQSGRDGVIVTGHWSTLGLHMTGAHIGTDTGCVWGGTLTAVRLEDRTVFSTDLPALSTSGQGRMMSGSPPPITSIASVTVALNPEVVRLAAQLNSLAPQVTYVILVDNGSQPPLRTQLSQFELPSSLIWIELSKNQGIAGGLNAGILEAARCNAEFVISMDHDSVAPLGCIQSLHEGLMDLEQQGRRVAAVGPNICDARDQREAPFIKLGLLRHRHLRCEASRTPIETDILISSGCFARTTMYQDTFGVGPLDDSLFIDSVDFEWCCRARSRGFLLYGICRATLDHRLGDSRQKLLGGWSIVVHSPNRLYYMTRNRIALYGRSYIPLRWKSKDVLRMGAKLATTLLFLAPRRAYLKASIDGALDAFKGRSGAR